jgi:hypothetical protein
VNASSIVISHRDEPPLVSFARQALNLTLPVVLLALGVVYLGGGLSTGDEPARADVRLLSGSLSEGPAAVYYLIPPTGAPRLDAAQWMAGRALDNIIVISNPEQEGAVLRSIKRQSDALLAFGHPGIEVVNLLSP